MTPSEDFANRVAELLELARLEGIDLPIPAHLIAERELCGDVIDLLTGEIFSDGADCRAGFPCCWEESEAAT